MRDEYYEDQDEISIDDLEEEWFDDDDPVEEPAPQRTRAERPRRERADRAQFGRRKESPADASSEDKEQAAPHARGILGRRSKDRDQVHRERRTQDRKATRRIDRGGQNAKPAPATTSSAPSPLNDLLLLAFKIGLVAAFLIFMTTFFFGITQARDTSMEPAVKEGDLVIYYRPDKSYVTGDAIVVDYNGRLQVRRVVAVAGDTVDISSDGGLIVNGSTQIEADIYTQTLPYTDGITFPVTVGDGEVFVLGDDRTSAEDSRIYGTVSISATKGAVMTVIRRRGI